MKYIKSAKAVIDCVRSSAKIIDRSATALKGGDQVVVIPLAFANRLPAEVRKKMECFRDTKFK